jgi:hypothetical protein
MKRAREHASDSGATNLSEVIDVVFVHENLGGISV